MIEIDRVEVVAARIGKEKKREKEVAEEEERGGDFNLQKKGGY